MLDSQNEPAGENKEAEDVKSVEVINAEVVEDTAETIEEPIANEEKGISNHSLVTHTEHNNPFASVSPSSTDSFELVRETANALTHIKQIAHSIMNSQLCPLKKEGDIVVAILTGNQYGFPFMTSINNIYPINGKPTMSVHIMRALIIKHKIIFKKVCDYEPLYEFGLIKADGGWDLKEVPNPANPNQPIKVPKIIKVGLLAEKGDNFAIIKEVDKVTRYSFKRLIKLDDGSFEPLEITSEFKMSDAARAGLLDKDNWVKHPPRMLDARAFAIGSREIGADVLLGIYSLNELADEHNIKYTISDSLSEEVN